MELILHVGLKKTATSSIQEALGALKPHLAAAGLCLPGTSVDHQRLARSLVAGGPGNAWADRVAEATLDALAAEAREAGLGRVLISSEHLISAPARALWRLRDMLEERFPEVRSVKVLCYLREPVSFAASMCQQDLKNGRLRLAEFEAAPWPFPWADWLGTQIAVFGHAAVAVRLFDPAHLRDGDVISDMLQAVGVPQLRPVVTVPRRNVSLSREGVQVAEALAALRPHAQRERSLRGRYKRLLLAIKGPRFVLPPEVQERVIALAERDLAYVREVFGLTLAPRRQPWMPGGLSPKEAQEIAERIVATVEAEGGAGGPAAD